MNRRALQRESISVHFYFVNCGKEVAAYKAHWEKDVALLSNRLCTGVEGLRESRTIKRGGQSLYSQLLKQEPDMGLDAGFCSTIRGRCSSEEESCSVETNASVEKDIVGT